MPGADLIALYRNDFRAFLHFLHQSLTRPSRLWTALTAT